WMGRLWAWASSVFSGGNSAGRSGASTWNRCSGRTRSFRRRSPRSRNATPAGRWSRTSSWVAPDSSTWPPWATAARRATRLSGGPRRGGHAPCPLHESRAFRRRDAQRDGQQVGDLLGRPRQPGLDLADRLGRAADLPRQLGLGPIPFFAALLQPRTKHRLLAHS